MDILNALSSILRQQPQTPIQQIAASVVPVEDKLYSAFAKAETGSFNNPWIRTVVAPKEGSTAYGPVQITNTKAEDYVNRGLVSKESAEFYKSVLKPMYENFKKYGRETKKQGYDKDYDYGGSGKFDVEKLGKQYEKFAKEMLLVDYKKAGEDIKKTIPLWRGVKDDERYNTEVLKSFGGR
jgi:hypothetical protein